MKTLTLIPLLLLFFASSALAKRIKFGHMGRNFVLVLPETSKKASRPLLVLLHGCKQNPSLMLDGTMLEDEASKNNFILLAPEQSEFSNADHCWNWFLSFQQQRNQYHEMGQIISAVKMVMKKNKVDPQRVFVTGISAGGAMTHNLTACYPDVFSASAIHSGLNFKVAETISEAQTVLTSSEQKSPEYLGEKLYECGRNVKGKKLKKVLILHGTDDARVPSLHAELISQSQGVWRDMEDDGLRNHSARGYKTRKSSMYPNGYSVEKTDTAYQGFVEQVILVKGLGHAWGGGRPLTVNFDPKAPSSSDFILKFFGLKK
ncbi:MAG: alpha/beta hydrolase family esterase [Bacteriovoracia bacterium]